MFYKPVALPVTKPTRKNITFQGLAHPKLIWGSSKFVFDHKRGRVAMPLVSTLMPVPLNT